MMELLGNGIASALTQYFGAIGAAFFIGFLIKATATVVGHDRAVAQENKMFGE